MEASFLEDPFEVEALQPKFPDWHEDKKGFTLFPKGFELTPARLSVGLHSCKHSNLKETSRDFNGKQTFKDKVIFSHLRDFSLEPFACERKGFHFQAVSKTDQQVTHTGSTLFTVN